MSDLTCDFCGAEGATPQMLPDLRYPDVSEDAPDLVSHWGHPLTGNVCRKCAVEQLQ